MSDNYKRIVELEEQIRKLHSPNYYTSEKQLIELAMDGKLENIQPLDVIVGTLSQIEAERLRRTEFAKRLYKKEHEDFMANEIHPRAEEIYNLTVENTPNELTKAIQKMYGMAYERGHRAGYSEVYNDYQSILSDTVELLALLRDDEPCFSPKN